MDCILPPGDGHGADEADSVAYLVWADGQRWFDEYRPIFKYGASVIESIALRRYQRSFTDCDRATRDGILSLIATSHLWCQRRFFEGLVNATLAGFLGDSRYGGNRRGLGWCHIGFCPHTEGCKSGQRVGGHVHR